MSLNAEDALLNIQKHLIQLGLEKSFVEKELELIFKQYDLKNSSEEELRQILANFAQVSLLHLYGND